MSGDELAFVSEEEGLRVSEVKERLRRLHGFPLCLQKLVCDGKSLESDDEAPADMQLVRLTEIPEDQEDVAGDELLEAVGGGHLDTVRFLLDAGVDKEFIDGSCFSVNVSALHHAAKGDVEIVRLLLDARADVNQQHFFDCETALMIAASAGKTEIVHLLLNAGADKNVTNLDGETVLMMAKSSGQAEIASLLADGG